MAKRAITFFELDKYDKAKVACLFGVSSIITGVVGLLIGQHMYQKSAITFMPKDQIGVDSVNNIYDVLDNAIKK